MTVYSIYSQLPSILEAIPPSATCGQGSGENVIMRSFMICTPHPLLCNDKINKNVMGWTCSTYGEGRGMYRVLVGKPEGKRPLGRPRHRWEDNIKVDL
jgi:hypothetical protein